MFKKLFLLCFLLLTAMPAANAVDVGGCIQDAPGADLGGMYIPGGYIYTNAKVPFSVEKIPAIESSLDRGIEAVSFKQNASEMQNLKKGEASAINVMGIVEMGNAGVMQAAINGNLKTIKYIDVVKERLYAYYFYYTKVTTIVYGE